jgi:PTS system ascorbate-specific IIC component
MVISPSLLNRHMKMITKNSNLALAHTGSLTYMISGYLGEGISKIAKGKDGKQTAIKSTESFNFPKGLAFLRNTNVSIALTMLILYLIVYMTT